MPGYSDLYIMEFDMAKVESFGLSLYTGTHRHNRKKYEAAWIAKLENHDLSYEEWDIHVSCFSVIDFSRTQLFKELIGDLSMDVDSADQQGHIKVMFIHLRINSSKFHNVSP